MPRESQATTILTLTGCCIRDGLGPVPDLLACTESLGGPAELSTALGSSVTPALVANTRWRNTLDQKFRLSPTLFKCLPRGNASRSRVTAPIDGYSPTILGYWLFCRGNLREWAGSRYHLWVFAWI